MKVRAATFFFLCPLVAWLASGTVSAAAEKTSTLTPQTPLPQRFQVENHAIVDRTHGREPVFFKGIGYSPYLVGETPLQGASPGDDDRYASHLRLLAATGANYLHVFPLHMPAGFFAELDKTDLVYGQDIWIFPHAQDFLDEEYQRWSLTYITGAIDHTYATGRPDRLVLFSIGDELQAESVARTDARHPEVTDYRGRHVVVTGRTPSEVAMAKLMDAAMDYELTRYGRRHLYCHTSWTHIGPIADRPDLEVPPASALLPDLGDLICLNVYTYANAVRTSPPGSVTGTSYQGYLEELAAIADRPVFVTQVGLSSSPIEPKPDVPGFGGHSLEAVAATYRQIWKDLQTAHGREVFTGISFFEFQDEWWKSGEDGTDSIRHEPEDPEEWFGIYAVEEGNVLKPKGDVVKALQEIFSGR